jgi:hypothetical protein
MRKWILGVALLAIIATSVGVSGGGAVTKKKLVQVSVDNFSVFPGVQGAPPGKVKFVVTNISTIEHEFVVIKTNKPAGSLLKGREANESGAVGEIDGVPAGSAKTVTLNLKKGHYALICNLPGHYLAGQFADFYVR